MGTVRVMPLGKENKIFEVPVGPYFRNHCPNIQENTADAKRSIDTRVNVS